jgi:hypothetical protein
MVLKVQRGGLRLPGFRVQEGTTEGGNVDFFLSVSVLGTWAVIDNPLPTYTYQCTIPSEAHENLRLRAVAHPAHPRAGPVCTVGSTTPSCTSSYSARHFFCQHK